jgi:acetyltransferase-like isoleucine patch superfamily enzyme
MYTPFSVTEHGELCSLSKISHDIECGIDTTVYAFTTIEENVSIGAHCVIGSNVFVGAGARIGDGTRIQHGAFICRGAHIGMNVFIGPLAILTDDKYPRVKLPNDPPYVAQPPTLEDWCSIGAGAVILAGVTVGAGSMVGAGAVVITDVPKYATVVKVPATVISQSDGE